MPVSYKSQIFKADPYQMPVSLDLMGKVLGYKQQKFEEAGAQVQSGINQLGNLDIIKPQDKDYINGKINNLVSQVNSFGGVDLSDGNISRQIESLGGDIYNDPSVTNALSATKSIRSLTNTYNQYKTDPKLNKLYSPVNEAWDMQGVSAYMSDDKVGAAYHGATAPTPYVDYKANLIKNIQGTKANYKQIETPNGDIMYTITGTERITPEHIMQEASDLLTADEKGQLDRDGWFTYKNAAPQDIVNKAIGVNQFKLSSAVAQLQDYKTSLLQSGNDALAKQNYTTLVQQKQDEIKAIQAASTPETLVAKYKQDPLTFAQGVYKDEFYRGLAGRFAYTKTTTSTKPNAGAMFNLKMQQTEQFHKDDMTMKQQQLDLELYKANMKLVNGKLIKGTPQEGDFTTIEPNVADPNIYKQSEDVFNKQKSDIVDENTKLTQDFLQQAINDDPELGKILESAQSGTGRTVVLKDKKAQDLISSINNTPGLQIEDLNFNGEGSNLYKRVQTGTGLTNDQMNYLQGLYDSYDKLTTGKSIGIQKLPQGFEGIVEKLQLNNERIKGIDSKLNGINSVALQEANLTPEELKYMQSRPHMQINNGGYGTMEQSLTLGGFTKKPKTDKSESELSVAYQKYQKTKNDYYSAVENRPAYLSRIISENDLGKSDTEKYKKVFSSILAVRGDNQGKTNYDVPKIANIDPVEIGKSTSGNFPYFMTANVTSADGKTVERVNIGLNDKEAAQFGFQSSPYDQLNESVNQNLRTSDLFVTSQLNRKITGRKEPLRAKIQVVRNNHTDRMDQSAKVQIIGEDGKPIVSVAQAIGPRADVAYATFKALLQDAEDRGLSYEQFIKEQIDKSY